MAGQRLTWLYRLILFLWLLLASGQSLLAHGGGEPQLTNEPVGPYRLSAWTNPEPPQVGEMHITLALALAETGDAVTEPAIQVEASTAGGERISAVASHEGALTPIFYEADLDFPATGLWQIRVQVEGDEGAGEATFPLDVQESSPNWLLIGMGGVAIIVILWLVWLLVRGGRKQVH